MRALFAGGEFDRARGNLAVARTALRVIAREVEIDSIVITDIVAGGLGAL